MSHKPILLACIISFLFIFACLKVSADNQESVASMSPTTPEQILFAKIPVVTASKKLQKSSEAPAAIAVITADQLRSYGARTLAEAVQYIPGMNIFGFSGTNIRGVGSGGRILLLVDGRRNNDVFTGGFEDGFERSLDKIERIEVIKGPASSLYGTNAFAGIINIITKDGANHEGVNARASGGNFAAQSYGFTWGLHHRSVDTFLATTFYSDNGTNQLGENDDIRAADLFGKLGWKHLTFAVGYRPNRTEIPAIGGVPSPESFLKRFDSFGLVQYENQYQDRWNFFSQFYFQDEILFFNDPTRDLDITDLRLEGEGRANYTVNNKDNVTFGLELRRDHTNNDLPEGRQTYRSTNHSVYAENEYRFTPSLMLTTGVRWDDNSVFGSSVNPRAGFIVNLSDRSVFKFFAGRAFRGPEFLDLFTDVPIGPFIILKNPLLKPEKVRTLEGEFSHPLGGSLALRVNVYYNALRDLITATLVGKEAIFENVGKASSYGFEAGINGEAGKTISFFANHTLQYAKDDIAHTNLTLIPRNTVNAGIIFRSTRGFEIGFLNKYVSSRQTVNILTGKPVNLGDYLKSDLTFSIALQKNVTLQTAIYNLFDVEYESNFATPQRGIQAVAGIVFRSR